MSEYAQGGYISGDPVPVLISPDECFISLDAVRAGRWICTRAGHPTPTSDCKRYRNSENESE